MRGQRLPQPGGKEVLQSRLESGDGRMYLVRAVVATDRDPLVVESNTQSHGKGGSFDHCRNLPRIRRSRRQPVKRISPPEAGAAILHNGRVRRRRSVALAWHPIGTPAPDLLNRAVLRIGPGISHMTSSGDHHETKACGAPGELFRPLNSASRVGPQRYGRLAGNTRNRRRPSIRYVSKSA